MKTLIRFAFIILIVLSISLAPSLANFSDIDEHQWFNSIEYLEESGIIGGYPDGSYQPDRLINRAEFTKIIIEAVFEGPFGNGENCFSDVKRGDWFAPYVCLAKDEAILSGYPDASFRPSQEITQPEALKIIFNAFQEPVEDLGGEWYEQYLSHSEWIGMLYFNPSGGASHKLTRAEMAYFIAWMSSEEVDMSDQIDFDEFYSKQSGSTLAGGNFEKLSPEDCYEGELYDPETQYCYIEIDCDTEAECLALEEQWYAENEALYEENSGKQLDLDEDDGTIITSYFVEGNNITLKEQNDQVDTRFQIYQSQTEEHQMIWDSFASLIPAQARGMITEFVIFSDEKDGTLAAVSALESDPKKWQLLVDIQDAFQDGKLETRELPHTLIHEFGHVLTLSAEQVTPLPYTETEEAFAQQQKSCFPNHMLDEGCSKPNAYINLFFKEYWRNFVDEWAAVSNLEDPVAQEDKVFELYEKYQDRFVTDYAATNLGEDIAESWTAFVMKTKPSGNSVADQKIQFFYRFPELVELRKQIAQRLQFEQSR